MNYRNFILDKTYFKYKATAEEEASINKHALEIDHLIAPHTILSDILIASGKQKFDLDLVLKKEDQLEDLSMRLTIQGVTKPIEVDIKEKSLNFDPQDFMLELYPFRSKIDLYLDIEDINIEITHSSDLKTAFKNMERNLLSEL